MGDSRRFDLFAKLAETHLNKEAHIVDVASGKGYLQAAMRQRGFKNITSWDKRKKNASNRQGYRYGYFDCKTEEKFDVVIAMHPDEATDHAVVYAGLHQVPAIICPCCIKPHATTLFERYNSKNWIKHLSQLAQKYNLSVQETKLPMNGKNIVLILKPLKKQI